MTVHLGTWSLLHVRSPNDDERIELPFRDVGQSVLLMKKRKGKLARVYVQ